MTVDTTTIKAPTSVFEGIAEYFRGYASNETFALVGLSILMWSELETTANAALALLIVKPTSKEECLEKWDLIERAIVACSGKDIRTTLGAIKSIIWLEFPDHYDAFDRLNDKIVKSYVNKRNIIAHRGIKSETKRGRVMFHGLKTIGKIDHQRHPFTREQLWQMPLEFVQHKGLLVQFVRQLGLYVPVDSDLGVK